MLSMVSCVVIVFASFPSFLSAPAVSGELVRKWEGWVGERARVPARPDEGLDIEAGWGDGERKAWLEIAEEAGLRWHYLSRCCAAVAVVIE